MAYYLGIQHQGYVTKLNPLDKSGKPVANSILELVKFTTSFNDYDEIMDNLRETEHDLEDGDLIYLIAKGPMKMKSYHEVPGTNGIVYRYARDNFIPSKVRGKIFSRLDNQAFIAHLYAFYLKKYGIYHSAVNILSEQANDPYFFATTLSHLLKYNFSDEVKDIFRELISLIDSAIVRRSVRFFTEEESKKYYQLIDNLEYLIPARDEDVIRLVNAFRNKIKNFSIPVINNLSGLYHTTNNLKTSHLTLDECIQIQDDRRYYANQLVDFAIYKVDPKSGVKKVQERNLFDLGIFLTNYDEYENMLQNQYHIPSEDAIYEDDDHEEFLEEEDFKRMHTTSEDQGITLRMTDMKKYPNKW